MGSVDTYRAILKVAQEGGFLERLPETDEEIEEEGRFYLEEAQKAYKSGDKNKTVKEIVNIGVSLGQSEVAKIFGDEPATFRGLPIPENSSHEPSEIPFDFTQLNPTELRKLHGEYGSYLARARWSLAIAQNKLASATHLRDAAYRAAYRKLAEKLKDSKPTQVALDNMAREDVKYLEFDGSVRTFTEDVVSYKALVEIYGGSVDRLSREWTMRQDDDRRG